MYPYGYYGSEWFHESIFIGAGPWFHKPDNFHGHVNNRYDRQHGYNGRFPDNGERVTKREGLPSTSREIKCAMGAIMEAVRIKAAKRDTNRDQPDASCLGVGLTQTRRNGASLR